MAADTGPDVLDPVLDQLGDPLGVSQELTGNAHTVDLALADGLSSHIGLHTAGADHGDVHKLLNMGNVVQVAVLRHVHRRMCPVPAIIRTVVGVKHIVAGILQVLGSPLGLGHITAHFRCVVTGDDTLSKALQLGLYGVAQGYRERRTALSLDGLDNFCGEAVTVLKRAAVLVGTLVEEFDGKLVQQIALVDSMDFHTVNTGIHTQLCGLGKGLDDLVDLLLGHLGYDNIRGPTGRLCTGRGQLVAGVKDGFHNCTGELILMQRANQLRDCPAAAHTSGQLDKELGTGLMNFFHEFSQILKHLGVLPQPLAPEGISQGCDAGDNQTNIIVCTLQEQLCCLFIEMTAAQFKPTKEAGAAHGTHNNAVLDLYIADLPGGK